MWAAAFTCYRTHHQDFHSVVEIQKKRLIEREHGEGVATLEPFDLMSEGLEEIENIKVPTLINGRSSLIGALGTTKALQSTI